MASRILTLILLDWALSFFGVVPWAYGHVWMKAQDTGAPLHWPGRAHLVFRANTKNTSGLNDGVLFQTLTDSLLRWKKAASEGFSFTYYQGTNTSLYPNHAGAPSDNSIYFTSNSSETLGCSLAAMTEVWFSNNGRILRADIRLNDRCFQFTENPGDTGASNKVYLGDVATHEFGHLLGLDHSQVSNATMVPALQKKMSKPACDELAAATARYNPGGNSVSGKLTGRIVAPNGRGIFGAHVNAVQLQRGNVYASALTDREGYFEIQGLEGADYGVMIEPFYPGASALSGFYKDISAAVCGGNSFERTFKLISPEISELQIFRLGLAQKIDVGTISVECSLPEPASASVFSVFTLGPRAFLGVFGNQSNEHFYQLGDVPLYASVLGSVINVPQDFRLQSAPEDWLVVKNFGPMTPGFGVASAVAKTPYYLLTLSTQPLRAALSPTNSRCESEDDFGHYTYQGEAPSFGQKPNDPGEGGFRFLNSLLGCGTIENSNGGSNDSSVGKVCLELSFLALLLFALRQTSRRFAFLISR